MALKKWTLIDHSKNIHVEELIVRPDDVGGAAKGYSIAVRMLRAGLSDGVTSIRVDNGVFAFDLLPTRGLGIWKAWRGNEAFGWQSPVRGPVHPKFVALTEPSGLGWLDGFDELLVRCGLESNGAPEFDEHGKLKYPLHGRIANRPAHYLELVVDGDDGQISLTGEVEESRFHFSKLRLKSTIATRVGEPGFRLHDEVMNLSQSAAESQLLYHVNFGRPLLDAGSRLVAPAQTVVPRNPWSAESIRSWDSYAAEQPGFAEQVYFLKLYGGAQDKTQVLLKNAHGTRGVSLLFNTKQLPCFTLWKNTTAVPDGYVTGLEPATNFPNPRGFEGQHNRVLKLAPGDRASFDLSMMVHGSTADVESAEKAVTAIQKAAPDVHNQPLVGWCAP